MKMFDGPRTTREGKDDTGGHHMTWQKGFSLGIFYSSGFYAVHDTRRTYRHFSLCIGYQVPEASTASRTMHFRPFHALPQKRLSGWILPFLGDRRLPRCSQRVEGPL